MARMVENPDRGGATKYRTISFRIRMPQERVVLNWIGALIRGGGDPLFSIHSQIVSLSSAPRGGISIMSNCNIICMDYRGNFAQKRRLMTRQGAAASLISASSGALYLGETNNPTIRQTGRASTPPSPTPNRASWVSEEGTPLLSFASFAPSRTGEERTRKEPRAATRAAAAATSRHLLEDDVGRSAACSPCIHPWRVWQQTNCPH